MALHSVHIGKIRLFDRIDLSLFHNSLTIKQSKKKYIIVSLSNLKKQHHGEVTFPNLKLPFHFVRIEVKLFIHFMKIY